MSDDVPRIKLPSQMPVCLSGPPQYLDAPRPKFLDVGGAMVRIEYVRKVSVSGRVIRILFGFVGESDPKQILEIDCDVVANDRSRHLDRIVSGEEVKMDVLNRLRHALDAMPVVPDYQQEMEDLRVLKGVKSLKKTHE